MKKPFDDMEVRLLKLLEPNARVSNRTVAKALGVTEGAVRHRLKKLISARSIRVSAILNPYKLGRTATMYVRLVVEPARIESIVEQIKPIPEVGYIAEVCGSADINFLMTSERVEDLFKIFDDQITTLPGIHDATYHLVKSVYKHEAHLAHIVD